MEAIEPVKAGLSLLNTNELEAGATCILWDDNEVSHAASMIRFRSRISLNF